MPRTSAVVNSWPSGEWSFPRLKCQPIQAGIHVAKRATKHNLEPVHDKLRGSAGADPSARGTDVAERSARQFARAEGRETPKR